MSKPLYIDDVVDLPNITDQQLDQLRVKNTADQYTLLRHIHQITATLALTPIEARTEIILYRQTYTQHYMQLKHIAKEFKEYIMYIFRWRARGLTSEQAIKKSLFDSKRRIAWATQQRKFWR